MRRIATAAGCTTGRITHYFADKDELMIAVLRSAHRSSRERIEATLRSTSGDAQLEGVIAAALPLDAERRDEWSIWMTFLAHATTSALLQDELRVRYDDWSALLARVIDDEPNSHAVKRLVAYIDGLGTRFTVGAIDHADIESLIHDGAMYTQTVDRSPSGRD